MLERHEHQSNLGLEGGLCSTIMLKCFDCGVLKPVPDLKFSITDGTARYRCRECYKRHVARRKEKRYKRHLEERAEITQEKRAKGLLSVMTGGCKKINAAHISEFNEALMNLFGGVQGYAKFYFTQIVIAAGQNPGGKNVLDACKTINQVITASTQHRGSAPDVEQLTDEDLARELKELHQEIGPKLLKQETA